MNEIPRKKPLRQTTISQQAGRLRLATSRLRKFLHRKKRAASAANSKAVRYTLRFFAVMLILTLLARGTSGVNMPRVKLQSPTSGVILQQTTVPASITARQGEDVPLPADVTVEYLAVSKGQSLKKGDVILQLDREELADTLAAAKVQLSQQQAQYASLTASHPVDASGVSGAQTALTQAQQDYERAALRAQIAVDDASVQQQKAQREYDTATQTLDTLQNQAQTMATPEQAQVDQAQQQVDAAAAALEAAERALRDAKLSQEDALLSAQRTVDNAETALAQAGSSYDQAKQDAGLAVQSNSADAAALNLQIQDTETQIVQLEQLLQTDGKVTAAYDTQVLLCNLQQGAPCPAGAALQLSAPDTSLAAQFTLPKEEAGRLTAGHPVTIRQGQSNVQTTVQMVSPADGDGNCQVTAELPQNIAGSIVPDSAAQAEITFSRNEYRVCLPTSAIRQDSSGNFVLTVQQRQSTFGITNLAMRIPVTVVETDSTGQYTAIEEVVEGPVIVSADRAVREGAAVRIES